MWIDEAIEYMASCAESTNVYVGADSKRFLETPGKFKATYSTVIVFHIEGNLGCRVFSDKTTEDDYGSIEQRLMKETSNAIECAQRIIPFLNGRNLEIHLDVSPDKRYKSNKIMQSALGYVHGATGYEAKIKPYAFAASSAADRILK
jgi:predicted RNase H-related nuclease YkuK (DUF458 family)